MPRDTLETVSRGPMPVPATETRGVSLRLHTPLNMSLKRVFDIAVSIALLLLTLPFMLIIAATIAIRDGGPIFFGHTRIGRHGRPFTCWKFRTMVRDSQEQLRDLLARDPEARAEWAETQKLKNDPRIIRGVGTLLRQSSLDELPQLWNVLKGDMSMVGPRPVIADELERYGAAGDLYKSVRPGITGPWQIGDRSDDSYETRVAKDSAYVREWSLLNDIRIVFLTAQVVFRRKGAY